MTQLLKNYSKTIIAVALFFITINTVHAQIPPNAVNADPSAKAISQVPLSPNIASTAVLKFKFTNEASSTNSTGQIPANSVRLTISFPGKFAYTSVNSIPKFAVEDFDDQPFGVVHLINTDLILEGEVVDLLLNVRGTATGSGTVTFNTDRITPITVANTQTANDNAQSTFTTVTILPVTLESFTAKGEQCTAKLYWKASAEIDLDHYEVEVSNDVNAGFAKVSNVAALTTGGTSKEYSYNYTMQGNKPYLFRLKIVDKNGSFKYSYVARINSGCSSEKSEVLIYPSPARSTVTINVSESALLNSKAGIFDMSGKRLKDFIITGNTTNVNVESLPSGIYVVRLSNGTNVKFVKN